MYNFASVYIVMKIKKTNENINNNSFKAVSYKIAR